MENNNYTCKSVSQPWLNYSSFESCARAWYQENWPLESVHRLGDLPSLGGSVPSWEGLCTHLCLPASTSMFSVPKPPVRLVGWYTPPTPDVGRSPWVSGQPGLLRGACLKTEQTKPNKTTGENQSWCTCKRWCGPALTSEYRAHLSRLQNLSVYDRRRCMGLCAWAWVCVSAQFWDLYGSRKGQKEDLWHVEFRARVLSCFTKKNYPVSSPVEPLS